MKLKAFNRPIRVAMMHYRDLAEAGGSLRVGETIANHVDPAKVAVEMVFAYGGPGPVAKRTKVPCHFIGASGSRDFAGWVRARRLLKKLQPDVIHFQETIMWLRAALLGAPGRKIVHLHGSYSAGQAVAAPVMTRTRSLVNPILSRTYLRSTAAQICINNPTRKELLELGWVTDDRACVVYNSIDLSRFTSGKTAARARTQLSLPAEALLLGFVSRLVWEKGGADFLTLVEHLPERWHGVICGDGPLKAELQRAAVARGLAGRIHFLGSLDEVKPVYDAIDAYAFVSRFEPFGLVLGEAMASGVPVFGLEREGDYNQPEYPLLPSNVAVMIPVENADLFPTSISKLASRIVDYGDHPERHRLMIERARSWIDNCFSPSIQATAMTRVYEDICRHGSPRQPLLANWYESKRREAMARLAEFDEVMTATA